MKGRATAYFLFPAFSLFPSSLFFVQSFYIGDSSGRRAHQLQPIRQCKQHWNLPQTEIIRRRSSIHGHEDGKLGSENAFIKNWTQVVCQDQVEGDAIKEQPYWRYQITQQFPPYQHYQNCSIKTLSRVLVDDWNAYPTVSQVRKACREERIVIFRQNINSTNNASSKQISKTEIENVHKNLSNGTTVVVVGVPNLILRENDVVATLTRVPDKYYPPEKTGYIRPPPTFYTTHELLLDSHDVCSLQPTSVGMHPPQVIYQDDHIALINKPENLTTIGDSKKRDDLQSILPFVLNPPCLSSNQPNKKNNGGDELKLPRPIHRLDRKTSGLVLVGKTNRAIKYWSMCFSKRKVKKTYIALVLDENGTTIDTNIRRSSVDSAPSTAIEEENYGNDDNQSNGQSHPNTSSWNVIEYPIDGKPAMTKWRVLESSKASCSSISLEGDQCSCNKTKTNGSRLHLLEVRPSSGRYHQIRRHLSYCLGCAIVGDAKYDGGSLLAKTLRTNGMFLCAAGIEYQYPSSLFEVRKDRDQLLSSPLSRCNSNNSAQNVRHQIVKRSTAQWCISQSHKDGETRTMIAAIPLPFKFLDLLSKWPYIERNNTTC